MKCAHAGVLRQRDDLRAGFAVVAAHQHVAVDCVTEFAQQLRRHVLKRRYHPHARSQHRLRLDHSRAAIGQLDAADLRWHERHGDVDQDFSGQRNLDLFQGRELSGMGNRQDHDVGVLRGPEVVGAPDEIGADARVDHGGGGLRAFRRPRADKDVMAGVGPAERQAEALLAGAAEHRDFEFGFRVHVFTPPA